ncbi:MAG TPA: glycosyltransferase, partial [Chthoniobacterales bacterium]
METALAPVTASDSLGRYRQAVAPPSFSLRLPPPLPQLQVCIVVPARNEESGLPHLVAALAGQLGLDGLPLERETFEIIILLNNCIDRSAAVLRNLRAPGLPKL